MDRKLPFSILLFVLLCLTMLVGGCKCSDDVDQTTDKMTGTSDVREMNRIKKDLQGISQLKRDQAKKIKKDTPQ